MEVDKRSKLEEVVRMDGKRSNGGKKSSCALDSAQRANIGRKFSVRHFDNSRSRVT